VTFEVLMALSMKMAVFWVVAQKTAIFLITHGKNYNIQFSKLQIIKHILTQHSKGYKRITIEMEQSATTQST
jgi:hypothetical protein